MPETTAHTRPYAAASCPGRPSEHWDERAELVSLGLVAIDRAARARRRRELRTAQNPAATPQDRTASLASASMEIDGLFNPGIKHRLERMEWAAVAKEDDRESGARPLDLDSGVIRLERPDEPQESPHQD